MAIDELINNEILDSIDEGLFTVDKTFKINYFNRAAERLTGFKREEVIGKYCSKVLNSELCNENCPIAYILRLGKNLYNCSAKIENRLGKKTDIELNAAILKNAANEPIGGVISFRNVSKLREIEHQLEGENNFHGVVGRDKKMKEIFTLIEEISDSVAPVLIYGESGTGKEVLANAIQATSNRKDKPYVKVNCSIFPDQILVSELFGHVKGAYTDAVNDRAGRFELADKGTIFLDEFAEMSQQAQTKLLRILQENTFERLGESETKKVNVRVIAATNLDINKALTEGKIREDLYYRLHVIPIHLPPLRERMGDVAFLIQYFIQKFNQIYKKNIESVSDDTMNMLMHYNYPGNVRELENIIEYGFIRTQSNPIITHDKLPPFLTSENSKQTKIVSTNYKATEIYDLIQLLEKHHWNKTKAANELGIGRTTLWRKLKSLNIDVE